MHVSLRILMASSAMFLAGSLNGALAAFNKAKDWPCIQREVPKISPGMVWSGSAIDPEDKSWSSDSAVAAKVAKVSSRREKVEDVIALIDQYASELKEDRAHVLTALFTGVLQNLNAERRQVMAGIKRFARRQSALADMIKKHSVEHEELSGKASLTEEERRRLTELQEQLAWDIRIHDERERSLRYVCETPVLIEQRLFKIGRHISQLLAQN